MKTPLHHPEATLPTYIDVLMMIYETSEVFALIPMSGESDNETIARRNYQRSGIYRWTTDKPLPADVCETEARIREYRTWFENQIIDRVM